MWRNRPAGTSDAHLLLPSYLFPFRREIEKLVVGSGEGNFFFLGKQKRLPSSSAQSVFRFLKMLLQRYRWHERFLTEVLQKIVKSATMNGTRSEKR